MDSNRYMYGLCVRTESDKGSLGSLGNACPFSLFLAVCLVGSLCEVFVPCGVERIRICPHLDVAHDGHICKSQEAVGLFLSVHRVLEAERPSVAPVADEVPAVSPMPLLPRVPAVAPPHELVYDDVVYLAEHLLGAHMSVVVCPSAQYRVERVDERLLGGCLVPSVDGLIR